MKKFFKYLFLTIIVLVALVWLLFQYRDYKDMERFSEFNLHNECLYNNNYWDCNYLADTYFYGEKLYWKNKKPVEIDYFKANQYYKKSCDLNNTYGCFQLARLYGDGKGVRQDINEAKRLYEIGCEKEMFASCNNLGAIYSNDMKKFSKAKEYFEKACNGNDATGCENLGILYHNGQGVKRNLKTAKEYYGKACDLGEQKGCDSYKKLK